MFGLEDIHIPSPVKRPENWGKASFCLCFSRRENCTHPATKEKPQSRKSTQGAALEENGSQDDQTLGANHRI